MQALYASASLTDKVNLFSDIQRLNADIIELGWPTSEEHLKLFERCRKIKKNSKIAAFGSTSKERDPERDFNLDMIVRTKADYACIFGKTWMNHVSLQLRLNPEENLGRIGESVKFLRKKEMKVIYDAEHFFDGYKDNPRYALATLKAAHEAGAEYLVLCDTNGGTMMHEAVNIINEVKVGLREKGINAKLGTHFHNDCEMAVANALYTAPDVEMIQGTVNGMGERVGNLNWVTFAANWVYKMKNNLNLNWKYMTFVSLEAFKMAGLPVPNNLAYVGPAAFAHKGGIHIDAIRKGAIYEHIDPGIFGNERVLLLTTQGGKASILNVAEKFGYQFDKNNPKFKKNVDRMFERLKTLESRGYRMEALPAEHFLLLEQYFGNFKNHFEIRKAEILSRFDKKSEKSKASLKFAVDERKVGGNSEVHGGPIHAFYHEALKTLGKEYKELRGLKILDYHVDLARRHGADSTTRTAVTLNNGESFTTVGVSDNILKSGAEAIMKGFNYYLNEKMRKV